ncbi:hypothetical protein FAIPA1_590010 [Frankia sp. AiPs1]
MLTWGIPWSVVGRRFLLRNSPAHGAADTSNLAAIAGEDVFPPPIYMSSFSIKFGGVVMAVRRKLLWITSATAVPIAVAFLGAPVSAAGPPAAPSGVTVASGGSGSARVSWTDNSADETGFDITNGSEVRHVGANATRFGWAGLGAGPSCFQVRSVNADGSSAWAPAARTCLSGPGKSVGGTTVGGTGNTAGGTTVGGAGNTIGGTTVGGSRNVVNTQNIQTINNNIQQINTQINSTSDPALRAELERQRAELEKLKAQKENNGGGNVPTPTVTPSSGGVVSPPPSAVVTPQPTASDVVPPPSGSVVSPPPSAVVTPQPTASDVVPPPSAGVVTPAPSAAVATPPPSAGVETPPPPPPTP